MEESKLHIINIMEKNISIQITEDYSELVAFFIENDLEYSVDEDVPTDLIKLWRAVDKTDGSLVGGCVLAKREGRFICDGIATDPKVRGKRIGERLLLLMENEARALGAESLYLVARAPGFFSKYGFKQISRENAPTFFECFSCPQYGVSCFPEVMRHDL